jgi:CHAT domain-containing protein
MPPARRLIVLPSAAMSGVPVALLTDRLSVSYIPSGTILAWLRERKSNPEAAARGRRLLAFGDPLFSPESGATRLKPVEPPGEGICIALVERFSNAERGGIHAGDVVLEYGGEKLAEQGDLLQAIGKKRETDKVPVSIWREGETLALLVDPGRLGVQLDPRPARETLFADRDFEGLLRGVRHASEILFPLPGTRREVEAIAEKCARRGVEVKQLLGSDAAEERISELVASGDLSTYRYLHFATHAVPSLERAFESSLFFSQSTAGGPREAAPGDRAVADGRLTAAEILRTWKLDADLVVLSACQTAVGVHTQEEGFLGFAQALLLAGARSVVLTLWKVDDAATTFLMTRFYENLLGARQGLTQPMQKVEALREAQGWLRGLTRAEVEALSGRLPALERGPERPIKRAAPPPGGEHPYASPRFWAAFILIGDPE